LGVLLFTSSGHPAWVQQKIISYRRATAHNAKALIKVSLVISLLQLKTLHH